MLPIALKLRNFLSYRENVPTLYLEDVHVACLCGANGHGKSALLDAMTWALWGKARGQRQEQLLHQGTHEMSVELEFETRGQRYRVVRRYAHARRQGTSSLELAVAAGDGYRPITSDTIAKTQAVINQLIGMDYDTFVNSAFLLQGRADLFTMATPTQRKDVLARVLDLGLYDRLEERAKGWVREFQTRLAATTPAIERLEQQASRQQAVAQELDRTTHDLDASQANVASLEERIGLLRAHITHLQRFQQEMQDLAAQLQRVESRRREAEQEVEDRQRRLAMWREITEQASQIEAGYQSLMTARQRLATLQATAQQYNGLERELYPLEERIVRARAALESEIRTQERHIVQELQPRVAALPALEEVLKQVAASLTALPEQEAEIAHLLERQHQATMGARRLEDDNTRIAAAGRDTRAKLDLLGHSHPEGVRCPLCSTPLDPEAMAQIQHTYHQAIETYQQQYREQADQLKVLDQDAVRLQAEVARRQRELETVRRQLVGQQAQTQAEYDQAVQVRPKFAGIESAVMEAKKTLEEGRYAEQEQAQAADLRQRLASMDFRQEDLAKVQQDAQALESWDEAYRRLQEAKSRVHEDEETLERASARREEAVQEAAGLGERLAGLEREMADLPTYQVRLSQLEGEHRQAAELRDQLQGQQSVLRHQLEEVEQAARELRQLHQERQTLVQQAGIYTELAQAFGKGGVQALLIEAAIPRLEEEANRLLARMTDGRMSLKFETQRERRGAAGRDGTGSIETLDILIADELGTRSYEMFSGGESFRVDFALRIALSKLLAWRAGAPLPTLFIDEGFGTQDVEGRDRILDVIRSIEPDFQRVLVITHLDEIKEAFPVRIEVTRTAAGSTFAVT